MSIAIHFHLNAITKMCVTNHLHYYASINMFVTHNVHFYYIYIHIVKKIFVKRFFSYVELPVFIVYTSEIFAIYRIG